MYKLFMIIGALVGWFAVIAQFYLLVLNRVMSLPGTVIQFFSYFTILTNILVALYFTVVWLRPQSRLGKWFWRSSTSTAVAVYIVIVGLVYNLILRALWAPVGLQKMVDEVLHTFIPLLFLVYWLLWAPKEGLKWKHAFVWILYPLFYSVYILVRGELSGLYPYPFIDVVKLGYEKALLNAGVMVSAFLLVSILLIGIAKLMASRRVNMRNQ